MAKLIPVNPDSRGYEEEFRCTNCQRSVLTNYAMKECDYAYCPWCGDKVNEEGARKMAKYKHNYLKELWWNRPWVYIPSVVKFMRNYPLKKKEKFFVWLRNCFYLNWQKCLVEVKNGDKQ